MATVFFHYFNDTDNLVINHVSSTGVSNSFSVANTSVLDISNLEDVLYLKRANTDTDNLIVVNTGSNEYTLDATTELQVNEPLINATIKVQDVGIDGDDHFSMSLSALCFHPHTEIETENGPVMIKDLKRGDSIKTLSGYKELSKLLKTDVAGKVQSFVKFPQGCFGENLPRNDVYCTRYHPVGVNWKQVPAENCIGRVNGCVLVKLTVASYYNLQFDTAEWIDIQGMMFTSHHPQHSVSPLPKNEYIDLSHYREGKFYEDTYTYEDALGNNM